MDEEKDRRVCPSTLQETMDEDIKVTADTTNQAQMFISFSLWPSKCIPILHLKKWNYKAGAPPELQSHLVNIWSFFYPCMLHLLITGHPTRFGLHGGELPAG